MSFFHRSRRFRAGAVLVAAAAATAIACADGTGPRSGPIVVRLTDAPLDSVESVNVFVVRVDAKGASTDSADAAASPDSASRGGWTVLAQPDQLFDLLALRTDTAVISRTMIPAGLWRSVRLVIDPARSYIVLKDGTELNGRTNLGSTGEPGIKFPSAATSGIKVTLDRPFQITSDTTFLTIDFDAGLSFVERGANVSESGFLFRPVIRATVKEQ